MADLPDLIECPACGGEGVIPENELVVSLTLEQAREVLRATEGLAVRDSLWLMLKEQTGQPLY